MDSHPQKPAQCAEKSQQMTQHINPNYWCEIAEKRRLQLEGALEENEKLWKETSIMQNEIKHYMRCLDEMRSFVDECKELLNDTGIDEGDTSQLDED